MEHQFVEVLQNGDAEEFLSLLRLNEKQNLKEAFKRIMGSLDIRSFGRGQRGTEDEAIFLQLIDKIVEKLPRTVPQFQNSNFNRLSDEKYSADMSVLLRRVYEGCRLNDGIQTAPFQRKSSVGKEAFESLLGMLDKTIIEVPKQQPLRQTPGPQKSVDRSPQLSKFESSLAKPTPEVLKNEIISSREIPKDKPVMIGHLDTDGFEILHSNHKSGQDAFAVSADKRVFAVCDGLGSYGKSGALARMLSREMVQIKEPLQDFFTPLDPKTDKRHIRADKLNSIIEKIKSSKEYQRADEFSASEKTDPRRKPDAGKTTLTMVQKQDSGEWFGVVIGDSPLYVVDNDGTYKSFGNDTVGSEVTPGSVGIKSDGTVVADIEKIIVVKLRNKPGRKFVLGSDWLSDNYYKSSRDYFEEEKKKTEKKLEEAYKNGYFIFDNQGRQAPEKIPFVPAGTQGENMGPAEKTMRGHIAYFKQQIPLMQPFNPLLFKDCRSAEQFDQVAKKGLSKYGFSKKELQPRSMEDDDLIREIKDDDATVIMIDAEKIK